MLASFFIKLPKLTLVHLTSTSQLISKIFYGYTLKYFRVVKSRNKEYTSIQNVFMTFTSSDVILKL